MRVSVVMPVRDALPWLDEAVASVLGQGMGDLELLAVDDGSGDGSRRRLDAWTSRDGRVRVLETGGRGIVPALNLGVREARADLVARMDADDVCLPDRLERQLARLTAEPGIDVLGCGAVALADGEAAGMDAYHRWVAGLVSCDDVRRECLVESPLVHSGVLARREVLLGHAYRTEPEASLAPGIPPHDGSTWPEDYDLWLRLLRAGACIANVPETLVRVRCHQGRLTVRHGWTTLAMARLKLHHLLETRLAGKETVVVQGGGRHGKMWVRLLLAAGVPVAAVLDVAEKRFGKLIEGVPVRPVSDLPAIDRHLVVAAVGRKGENPHRRVVREQLGAMDLVEGRDWVFVC